MELEVTTLYFSRAKVDDRKVVDNEISIMQRLVTKFVIFLFIQLKFMGFSESILEISPMVKRGVLRIRIR